MGQYRLLPLFILLMGVPSILVSEAVFVSSTGNDQTSPHCSWSGDCTYNDTSKQKCAEALCQAQGYTGTHSFQGFSNDFCSSSYTDDTVWIYDYVYDSTHFISWDYEAQTFASCAGGMDQCVLVEVGNSSLANAVTVSVHENFTCAGNVDKYNWVGPATYGDTFTTERSGSQVTVTRTDQSTGWTMNLRIVCCFDPCDPWVTPCPISGETCSAVDTCNCGAAATCKGSINNGTADGCAAASNACTCGGTQPECTGGELCGGGMCVDWSNNHYKMVENSYQMCTRITSISECEFAASFLGLSDTIAVDDGQSYMSYDPPYCYYEYSELKYNSDGSNYGSCGSDACLCKVTCDGVNCTVPGEMCQLPSGHCQCGSNYTCDYSSWAISDGCDFASSACTCGGQAACSGDFICVGGVCTFDCSSCSYVTSDTCDTINNVCTCGTDAECTGGDACILGECQTDPCGSDQPLILIVPGSVEVPLAGEITSPGFPNDYPNWANCSWLIQGPPELQIQLNFSTFDLESCCDHLDVYDGSNNDSCSMGYADGYTMTTTGPNVFLLFSSDPSWTETGFHIQYSIVNSTCAENEVECDSDSDSCYRCIPASWVCDGYDDCNMCPCNVCPCDGADERNCPSEPPTTAEPCCDILSITGLTGYYGNINGYYGIYNISGTGHPVYYGWGSNGGYLYWYSPSGSGYPDTWEMGPLAVNCTSYCPTDCEAGAWHDRSVSYNAQPNIKVECVGPPSAPPGYVKYDGLCTTANNGTLFNMAMSTSEGDLAYGSFGYGYNITEHDCLGWCEWKKTAINWTIHTACEWWDASVYGSACFLYGNNELVVSGGNATIPGPGGIIPASCYAYISGPISWHYPESAANGWLEAGYCAGTMQSPIDLDGSLEATIHAPIEYRNYFVNPNDNNRFFNGILQNSGHSIVWHLHSTETNRLAFCWKHRKCPSIRNGPFAGSTHTHAYFLLQLHFHWGNNGGHWNKGSEHTVDGKQHALEMHMVHIEDRYIDSKGTYDWDGALADPNGLAVLAIFFNVDPKKPQNMQPLEVIDETLEDMANVPKGRRKRDADADEEEQMEEMARFHEAFEQLFAEDNARRVKRQILHHTEVKLRLNPGAFIRKATNRGWHTNEYSTYWTYHGSLTTPTCNEVVTWVVFERVLHITQVQVNAFVHKFPNNFRTPNNLGSHDAGGRVDTMCGREIRLIHDQIEHHSGGFWG